MRVVDLRSSRSSLWVASAGLLAIVCSYAGASEAQTLDRIKQSGTIKLGYRADARPFSFQNDTGTPGGYAVALCTDVAEELKNELGLADLALQWVPLDLTSGSPR